MDKSKTGAFVISVIIMLLFAAVVTGLCPAPDASIMDLLKTAMTGVLWYWIGSSNASQSKDATIASVADTANKTATAAVTQSNTTATLVAGKPAA